MVNVGAAVIDAASRLRADLFFLGVTGVHAEAGLTTGDADEAAMKRALSRRAADTYVLGSAEKIGAASPFTVLGLGDIAGIITDAPVKDPTLERLLEAGVAILPA
jgi:DeoR/GlpR family transcriptional regulator of sugar metabolism